MEEEADLRPFVEGADAVVFAAGAGPNSGAERKRTVDLGAAVKLMDAGVSRYVMVSASARSERVTRRALRSP
jgi:acetate kinase